MLLGSSVLQADESNTILLNALSFVVAALLLLLTAVPMSEEVSVSENLSPDTLSW